MTEDGRSSEAAALCGFGPRLFEVWGNRDAQSDAVTNSLWPDTVAGFVLRTNQAQVSKARPGAPVPASVLSHPWRDEAAPRMGHPSSAPALRTHASPTSQGRDVGHPHCFGNVNF